MGDTVVSGEISKAVIQRNRIFIRVSAMLGHVYDFLHRSCHQFSRSLCLAVTVFGTSQFAMASPTVDQLSECLVKATTASDKTAVLQWTYVALSAHPDLQVFSNVTAEQKNQLDQKFAQVLQRVIVDQCLAQTKVVIQSDGVQAVAQSFQELGRQAGEDILKDPAVRQQLQGTLRYIDLNKLVMTFLTPDVLGKLGF